MKYSEPVKLNKGAQVYNIDKSNLEHYYIIDGKQKSLNFYSKWYTFTKYATTTEDLINNLPWSLGEMKFYDCYYHNINIQSDNYAIIILKDDETYDKNLIYLFNALIDYKKSFETFTLLKGNYTIFRLNNDIKNFSLVLKVINLV